MTQRSISLPLGIVLRRQPGVTRWARWIWRAAAVLPGAGPAAWRELRREGEAVEYHAATLPLELHRAETEAYRVALSNDPPSVYVVLREVEEDEGGPENAPVRVHCVTASPFEAQDYGDSGEEIVEPVPMPPALVAWVRDFVAAHHAEEPFRKRRRDRVETGAQEDGRGDPRIRQEGDVYLSPAARKRGERLH